MNYFTKNLRYLRKQKRLTQTELANIIGISRSTIGNWELGNRQPSIEDLIVLADFFGLEIDILNKDLSDIPNVDFS